MEPQFSTYTKKELLKKLKTQKTIFVIHSIVIVLMIVFAIFSTIENGFSFSNLFPLCFLPMEVFILMEMKKIKKEYALRT